jgi:hypothetical protein
LFKKYTLEEKFKKWIPENTKNFKAEAFAS